MLSPSLFHLRPLARAVSVLPWNLLTNLNSPRSLPKQMRLTCRGPRILAHGINSLRLRVLQHVHKNTSPIFHTPLLFQSRHRTRIFLSELLLRDTSTISNTRLSDDCRSHAADTQIATPKRGNNRNGRKGTLRCQTCRKARKKVSFVRYFLAHV
jgi:hypothetical protein